MSKKCNGCGCLLDDSAAVCPNCGASQNTYIQNPPRKAEKNSTVLIVLAFILSIIIIIGSIFLVYLLKNRNEEENNGTTERYSEHTIKGEEPLTKPVTLAVSDISDSELRDAVNSGKVNGKVTPDATAAMVEVIQLAKQKDGYAEIPSEQAMDRISEITGKSFSSSALGGMISSVESENSFAVKFPSDNGSETFLIFSKNKNAVYTVNSADFYAEYLKLYKMDYDCVEKILTGKGIDDCDVIFVSDSTGEIILTSHKSGNFVFYYDYNGELLICLKNSGASMEAFDSGFNAVNEDTRNRIFSTAITEIQNRFGFNIKL